MKVRTACVVLALGILCGCGKGDGGGSTGPTMPSPPVDTSSPAPSNAATVVDLESIRAAFQACFATAPRGAFGGTVLSAACGAMPISEGFLHQGRNRAQEFDALLADDTMDGATFSAPEILWQPSAARVLARFPFLRANGVAGSLVTVATKTGETWALVGNGREFNTFSTAFANRRISLRPGQAARLETGLLFHLRRAPTRFSQDADVQSVTVFGPGLPGFIDASHPGAGLSLTSLPNCRFWSISANGCANLWRLRIDDLGTGSPIPLERLGPGMQVLTANPYLSDAEIAGMPPNAVYKWVIALVPGSPTALARRATTLTYWDRVRARPLTSAEIGAVGFLDMTQETLDLLQNFNGGGKPTLAWTQPENAAPAFLAAMIHGRFIDFQRVKPPQTYVTMSCFGNPNCEADGSYRTGMSFNQNGNTTFAMFQLISRRNGIQIFSQYTR